MRLDGSLPPLAHFTSPAHHAADLVAQLHTEAPMHTSPAPENRRKFARNSVKAYAFVHSRGRFQRAVVIDYSQGGLQLEGTFGLFKNDAVEIEFISGTRVSGAVAWSLGPRTGVAFAEPLDLTHPAIIELAYRAKDRSFLTVHDALVHQEASRTAA
jgi:hypothetical protein